MDYKHEYGRYKQKCSQLFDENKELKETLEGYKQIVDMNYAMIAILVERCGATEEKPLEITRAEINEALQGKLTRADFIEDYGYKLWPMDKNKENDNA